MVTVYALAIVVLLLCSAFFSGAEMAVFAYDRTEARELARHGKGPLPHLYRNLHIFLPTVICLNLVVNMGINVLAAVFTDEHLGTAYLPLAVSYTHLRAHETPEHLVCRLLLEKKKKNTSYTPIL